MNNRVITLAVVSLLAAAPTVTAANCAGCVPLDVLTFDKLLSKFPVSIVKFDVAYPYGDKHDEFAKVAKDGAGLPDLLVGEVGIKDYGEQENGELGSRFKIAKEEYPTVIIFIKNNKEGSIDHHKFGGEFTADNLKAFIKQKSGLRMPTKGCVEEMDLLAEKFLSSSKVEQKETISAAETRLLDLTGEKLKSAKVYIKVMEKLVEEGAGFLEKEETRLTKLLAGNISAAKKVEMEDRINILKSFSNPGSRDEL